jgi:hypothetical protein
MDSLNLGQQRIMKDMQEMFLVMNVRFPYFALEDKGHIKRRECYVNQDRPRPRGGIHGLEDHQRLKVSESLMFGVIISL